MLSEAKHLAGASYPARSFASLRMTSCRLDHEQIATLLQSLNCADGFDVELRWAAEVVGAVVGWEAARRASWSRIRSVSALVSWGGGPPG